jgi:hypothetical protein
VLKSQDILVALKLLVENDSLRLQSFSSLADSVGMSVSETHAAVKRGVQCRLLSSIQGSDVRRGLPRVSFGHLIRFVEFGIPYVFPAERGAPAIGIPTGLGAEPLCGSMIVGSGELLPVWPSELGKVRGIALEPLYRSCPVAAGNDSRLYRLLTLIDAIRDDDGVRQQRVAFDLFQREIHQFESSAGRLATIP